MNRYFTAIAVAATTGCASLPPSTQPETVAETKTKWVKYSINICPQPGQLDTYVCPKISSGPVQIMGSHKNLYGQMIYQVEAGGHHGFIPGYAYSSYLADEDPKIVEDRAAKKRVAEKAECDRRGGVRVGMTREQVHASCWGKPTGINSTITAGSRHEQLVYRGYNYVYLRDGVVTSIQTSK